jgi:hypothetical protein
MEETSKNNKEAWHADLHLTDYAMTLIETLGQV